MSKNITLSLCGFDFGLVFSRTENKVFKKEWIKNIYKYWGEFVEEKNPEKVDYVIEFCQLNEGRYLTIREGKYDFYCLAERKARDYLKLSYTASLFQFSALIKEAILGLLKDSGFVMHASSSLSEDGDLFVFTSVSGGGKSTTARLLEKNGWRHFSDDSLIIRKVDGKYSLFAPPFIEKEREPVEKVYDKGRVLVFFVNKKSDDVRAERIDDKGNILKKMLESVKLLDENISKEKMGIVTDFVDKNEFYSLYRNLDSKKLVEVLNEIK